MALRQGKSTYSTVRMETRTILQIVLGSIIVAIVGLGSFIVYQLTKEAETVVVERVVDAEEKEYVNPWADKGNAAVALVKAQRVTLSDEDREALKLEEDVPLTLGEIVENEKFVKDKMRISSEARGWAVEWWGETDFGPHFFLVHYVFEDGAIEVGPEWLVDLKERKVASKNLPSLVAEHPEKGVKSEYYGKEQQVISAIGSHRFDSKMSLAGALLLYFEQRSDASEDDTIVGWTIAHERGNLFKAYFQWVEDGEQTYAEFEFDYDRKALKSVNLQAANIMNVGEDFEKQRVSVMPTTYNPSASNRASRWTGAARKQCRNPRHRARCNALASILSQKEIVESLEWLLTAQANTAEEFELCKRERRCGWVPQQKDENVFNVKYNYKLHDQERTVSWDVDTRTGDVKPMDRVARLAFSVVRAR